ncbi:MAG TPA: hypothetical protein VFI22_15250, partial [Thermomicrobiales bacterium]|nr:hypothetical protein [Thermomicrobiales bacterium]
MAEKFFGEKRIAPAAIEEHGDAVRLQPHAEGIQREAIDLMLAKRGDGDRRQHAEAAQLGKGARKGRVPLGVSLAERSGDEQPARRLPRHRAQEIERGRIGPLEIVDDQQERRVAGNRVEQVADRLEE